MATVELQKMTPAEYLAFERASDLRHEFVNGEVREVTGARRPHNLVAGSIFAFLYSTNLEGTFEVYQNDMRVRIPGGSYYYPDVVVTPSPPELEDDYGDTVTNPLAAFEVTSPSTEAIDRSEKLANYQRMESLTDYLIVSQDEVRVDHYRRIDDRRWELTIYDSLDAMLSLSSIKCELPLKKVYERVDIK
ncbi:Uma2 family endonuclease [Stratiformator vulcanicus]|uniref:Putative restriction endonuclease domain-containing protein n=1 Tax=Stratiformator vulcanicus TaxID=2527980 RepID=A0A517R540_9PLAN|nr:Uma2 family endonuclease [Stratiformator vulcanicus]QDT38960.1 hypothetical protein Pan189_33600 [Stratiformator vulcanicus]